MSDDFDDLLGEDESGTGSFRALAGEVERRCTAANIECKVNDEGIDDDGFPMRAAVRLSMPSGKNKRQIVGSSTTFLGRLLSVPFEHFTLFDRFDGILDKKNGRIEARVRPLLQMAAQPLMRRLYSVLHPGETPNGDQLPRLYWPEEHGLRVSIGPTSEEFAVFGDFSFTPSRATTLVIEGVQTERHDDAIELLERAFNALNFSLDLNFGISFLLSNRKPEPRLRSRGRYRPVASLEFPKQEYDAAPMSLYWYAGSARGMPLLQYLAYYQVLEFYFPMYSTREAGRKVQALLKDPSFRLDRDADITRMLNIISAPKGGGYGSEREQLRAAIAECVEHTLLQEFFEEDSSRKAFFGTQQKGLTQKRISLRANNTELCNEVADLVYDIRCRIVHTKGVDTSPEQLLLPYSKEAELLGHNIELIQFLARKVLIAASTPFKI